MYKNIEQETPKMTKSVRKRRGPKWVPPTHMAPKIGISPILAKRVKKNDRIFPFSFPKQAQSVIPLSKQSLENVPNFQFSPPKSVKPVLIRPPKNILTNYELSQLSFLQPEKSLNFSFSQPQNAQFDNSIRNCDNCVSKKFYFTMPQSL